MMRIGMVMDDDDGDLLPLGQGLCMELQLARVFQLECAFPLLQGMVDQQGKVLLLVLPLVYRRHMVFQQCMAVALVLSREQLRVSLLELLRVCLRVHVLGMELVFQQQLDMVYQLELDVVLEPKIWNYN